MKLISISVFFVHLFVPGERLIRGYSSISEESSGQAVLFLLQAPLVLSLDLTSHDSLPSYRGTVCRPSKG